MNPDRYEQGLLKLKEIDGEIGEQVIESLKDIAPDLGRYVIRISLLRHLLASWIRPEIKRNCDRCSTYSTG